MTPERSWVLKMAWRDSRGSRARLLVCMSAIVAGVAALVAIGSLGDSLRAALLDESKSLLGADLIVRRSSPFDAESEQLLSRLGGERSDRVSFASMALFPRQQVTQLVEVRAVETSFPFYGDYQSRPAGRLPSGDSVLVDRTLLLQYGVGVGDPIKIGEVVFEVGAELLTVPGESASLSALGARVFIPLDRLDETGLIRTGSRVGYSAFFRFPSPVDADALVKRHGDEIRRLALRTTTVSERRASLGRSLDNLDRFLNLAGFVALVLGGVGVASSVNLYIKQRLETVALLRCVGATARNCLLVYLLQCSVTAFIGAVLGAVVGVTIQHLFPWLLGDLLPPGVVVETSWTAVAEGVVVGVAVALLFVLLPLAPLRRVSPLRALRAEFGRRRVTAAADPMVWAAALAVVAGLLVFTRLHTSDWRVALGFSAGLAVALGLLLGAALLLTRLLRQMLGRRWGYEVRQGLANLYRPHNQTAILVVAVGAGTLIVLTLLMVQGSLAGEVERVSSGGGPNLILFDIQSDQKEPVRSLLQQESLPIEHDVPIVTMRLAGIEGRPVDEIRQDPRSRARGWALRREYRCTYRNQLDETEELVAGRLQQVRDGGRVLVTLEEGLAGSLAVEIGDELTFDVAGVAIDVEVGGLRKVNWDAFQTNFFVVFPEGILEEAPQFHVLTTRTGGAEQSARIQRSLVGLFPNVSSLDLELVVQTINGLLDRVTLVLSVMALVTIVTGVVVLAGAVAAGRYQRSQEQILLRTLGASKTQLQRILVAEYLLLGLLAAAAGLLLSLGSAWALTRFVFEIPLAVPLLNVAGVVGGVVTVTLVVGIFNNRGLLRRPPLASLRAEI